MGQFVAANEADRHQQEDRDRVIEFLGDLDAPVNPCADDPQKEAERDRRQQILLERYEDPGDLIGRGLSQQGHGKGYRYGNGERKQHHAGLAENAGMGSVCQRRVAGHKKFATPVWRG